MEPIEKLHMRLAGLERLVHSPKLRKQLLAFINERFQMSIAEFLDKAPSVYAATSQDPVWTVRNEPGPEDAYEAKLIVLGKVDPQPVPNLLNIDRAEVPGTGKTMDEVRKEGSYGDEGTPESSPY